MMETKNEVREEKKAQSRKSNSLRGLIGSPWGKQAENEFIT